MKIHSIKFSGVKETVNKFQQEQLEYFGVTFMKNIRRKMLSGIFKHPTTASARSWRFTIKNNTIEFFNSKKYIWYLNYGRKSQAMHWLEGKTVPIRIGNMVIFRNAKNVGRPNKNSKSGRLFYMKSPDKGKKYLGFIDSQMDLTKRLFSRKFK